MSKLGLNLFALYWVNTKSSLPWSFLDVSVLLTWKFSRQFICVLWRIKAKKLGKPKEKHRRVVLVLRLYIYIFMFLPIALFLSLSWKCLHKLWTGLNFDKNFSSFVVFSSDKSPSKSRATWDMSGLFWKQFSWHGLMNRQWSLQ